MFEMKTRFSAGAWRDVRRGELWEENNIMYIIDFVKVNDFSIEFDQQYGNNENFNRSSCPQFHSPYCLTGLGPGWPS